MSFAKQLIAALVVMVLCASSSWLFLSVNETRAYIARQLQSHARDAAHTLGLSISLHLAEDDPLFTQSIVDAVFDSGDYLLIRVDDLEGRAELTRERELKLEAVPQWFVNLVPLDAPQSSAELAAGWNRTGTVTVRSHPGHAYQQLWTTVVRTAQSIAIFALISFVVFAVLVRWMLKPLKAIERQAKVVARRKFELIDPIPKTPELRSLAISMNDMTERLGAFVGSQTSYVQRLESEVFIDSVTGLRSRQATEYDIEQLARHSISHGGGALMLVNVVGLDATNKTGGYKAGDAFVRAVSGAIRSRLSGYPAAIGRFGGAVFSIVLSETTIQQVTELSQTIEADIRLLQDSGHAVEDVQIGCAFHDGADDAKVLIQKCLIALRNAEEDTNSALHIWRATETVDSVELHNEAYWRDYLSNVIETRAMVLEAQPVRARDEEQLLHLEVLGRIRDEQGRLVPAGRFMPIATRLGLVVELDRLIVAQTIALIESGRAGNQSLAINLSSSAVADASFRAWLTKQLAGTDAARQLCVELNEHLIITNRTAAEALIDCVHQFDVQVGVDHCGANDISLTALQGLQIDYVKLDGSLVNGIEHSREREDLVRSLVHITHGMGLLVVAEFVENEAELEKVQGLGFDAYQGFLIGRPALLGEAQPSACA